MSSNVVVLCDGFLLNDWPLAEWLIDRELAGLHLNLEPDGQRFRATGNVTADDRATLRGRRDEVLRILRYIDRLHGANQGAV